jgi:hypothetical protein
MTSNIEIRQQRRVHAIERLLAEDGYNLKPGDVLYTTTLHTSRSGMTRHIKVTQVSDGKPHDISGLVAIATGQRTAPNGGIIVGGCGMDMGFSVVYDLSRTLFPKGHNCTGEHGCPSNDHSNDYGSASHRADEALGVDVHGRRERFTEWRAKVQEYLDGPLGYYPERVHSDGGYAISQRWL